ncbi:glycosyltransferase [Apibacter muscae]|uniref:Glycosyltransferase n=1 Tax=Apibacter muscae TaxID=2509004 RepID=A0A563DG79_9FLAO|nr:glycosyltransferase [Apibacter muscae]TWP29031.1 glycosyltransferase [Apibacter muscae]TWP30388.1 glycosyltransferase [Apibacter muscae]
MNNTIVTVIVTYNRLELLKKCIQSLKDQTLNTHILVVNNGSTDGTKNWLLEQKDIVVINQENEGGAGGFYRGMKEAYERGYDWIWVMDDDAFPEKDCLNKLMLYSGEARVLAPLVIENENIDKLHRGRINFDRINIPIFQIPINNYDLFQDKNISITIDFISFIGLLMNRDIIEEVGYPKKEYFIFNDDVEYSLRIKKKGIKCLLIKNTCIYHKKYEINKFELGNYKFFRKEVKNIFFYKKFKKEKKIPYFRLLEFRNSIINVLDYSNKITTNKIFIIIYFLKQSLKSLFIFKEGKKTVFLLYISLIQGLHRNINNKKIKDYYDK